MSLLYDLYSATKKLREAQKTYMADRGNLEKGLKVGEAAAQVDIVLDKVHADLTER